MSFFFTKAPTKPVREVANGGGTPTAGMKRNATTLHRLGCAACPLNHAEVSTPKMPPTIAKETRIYFLAEAPGKHEDESSGRPLTGPTGRLLRELIPEGKELFCSFDNTVRDRPPKNRTPEWQEIECCRGHVTKSIEQAKPKLIVGLGAVPLHWMLASHDISGMRGRLFRVKVGSHSCWFLPTYHPSYILRKANNKAKPLNSFLGFCLRMDIQRAFANVDRLPVTHIENEAEIRNDINAFAGPNRFEELMMLLEQARLAPIKAVDLETEGLRPFLKGAAIMTVAISFGTINFSFALNHPKTGWTPDQRMRILGMLRSIVRDDTAKVAHNAPFEIEWLIWLLGKEVVNHLAWHCTQMQAHFLDERRGKSHGGDHRAAYQALDFLCKQHFGVAYKSLFKLDKKHMSKTDLTECLLYNGVDTKYTLRLFHEQTRLLELNGTYGAYIDALPRQASVALMQTFGVLVDQQEVLSIQGQLGAEIAALDEKINALKVVKQFKLDHKEFNPASDKDVVRIFRDYLKCPEVSIIEEEGTRYSTDKSVLSQIEHPLAPLVLERRNRSKMKSTYCDELVIGQECCYPDGYIHCNFNTTFAETGRTSSDQPNMQNFPQRNDAWVRKQVVAEKGHLLVAADYGQLEACTAAMCSRDAVLVEELWVDYDIHKDFAEKVLKEWPEMAEYGDFDTCRSVVKNKFVFPAIFGAAPSSIAGYLGMPEETAEKLSNLLWAKYHGLKAWQDKTVKKYYDVGWVETPNHRRHHYPLTRNQAINQPIQGLACEIVCDAMNRLSYQAVTERVWHLHPRLNIHDDLTFSIPDSPKVLDESIETIYRTMLTPPYKCVNVPLSVKLSVGKNWYEMETVGKFWSHKDL